MKVGRPKGVKDPFPRKRRIPYKSLSLIGKRFGKLIVLKLGDNFDEGMKRKNRVSLVEVICDCGNKKEIDSYSLTKRKIISCGCAQKDSIIKRQFKGKGVSVLSKLIRGYKAGARVRNYCFELTREEVENIIYKNCFYCNKIPSMKITNYSGTIIYNGIDRVDNSKGYITRNCVPCCKPCNLAKHNISKEMILILYKFFYES